VHETDSSECMSSGSGPKQFMIMSSFLDVNKTSLSPHSLSLSLSLSLIRMCWKQMKHLVAPAQMMNPTRKLSTRMSLLNYLFALTAVCVECVECLFLGHRALTVMMASCPTRSPSHSDLSSTFSSGESSLSWLRTS